MRLFFLFALCAVCLADHERRDPAAIPAQISATNWPDYPVHIQWWTLNGKTADPCASKEELDGIRRTDCVGDEWPTPAVTVLIPNQLSFAKAATPNMFQQGMILTIRGKNMMGVQTWGVPNPIPSAQSRLRLSKRNRGCDDIDFDLPIAAATCYLAAGSVLPNCDGLTFIVPAAWHANQLEHEDAPRRLCWSRQQNTPAVDTEWRYTGFKIGVVWDCATSAECVAGYAAQLQTEPFLATQFEQAQRTLRTTCCRHNLYQDQPPQVGGVIQYAIGQCINAGNGATPGPQSCCQGAAIENSLERCCDRTFELVQWYHKPCNCRENPTVDPRSPTCPTGEVCCTHKKFKDVFDLAIIPPAPSVSAVWPQHMGECYNPATHRCCDTGFRYDPGQDQCCVINGIQSLNTPCPCNDDDDCAGGQMVPAGAPTQTFRVKVADGMICCRQSWPQPNEQGEDFVLDTTTRKARCSKWANFPSGRFPLHQFPIGTAPYQNQRCLGTCMDNRYQICCNGVTCRKEFEKCCNASCCNKYSAGCIEGMRQGTPNNRWNYNELDQPYEVCTTIEILNPLKGFWLFVWPAYLLTMTCVSMAFVIAFVGKSSRRSFAFLERAMIVVAFLTIILGVTNFFAPVYKYGVWLVIVSLFTVVVAAARMVYLNGVLVIVQFITLMYLFDPLNGNNYLNFSSLRTAQGLPDPAGAGILHSIQKIFPNLDQIQAQRYCTTFYDYFSYDPQMYDYRRTNPAKLTFGYCGDGWITALLIFQGIVLMLVLVQFILDLVAFVLRFKEERSYDPIELEVRGVDEVAPMYPY